jgi:hypothetical protein
MIASGSSALRFAVALAVACSGVLLAQARPSTQQPSKTSKPAKPATQAASTVKPFMTVYKTPTCGCCGKWVEYMRAAGFDVEVHDLNDLTAIKKKLGVPQAMSTCHTARVGRYVLEGHVPVEPVRRLLKERPTTIIGLAVPGMPWGSPGMEVPGAQTHPYSVLTFDSAGQTTVFERR